MSTRQHSRITRAYQSYLTMAFEQALDAARQAGTSAFAATLMQRAPVPQGEDATTSVCLDLTRLSDDELRLLSQWEG